MSDPSGVDAPAPDAPQMIGDPFRVIAAASQGDWERAERIIRDMSDSDLDALARVTGRLVYPVTTEQANRRFNRLVGDPQDPAASSAAAAPPPTEHGHE